MGDRRIEILSREDQGTVFMLCLTFGLAIFATLYFICRWQHKRTLKQLEAAKLAQAKTVATKHRLKQTFSRFSQVDDELTMTHIDHDDLELLQQSCQMNTTVSTSGANPNPPSYNMAAVYPDAPGGPASSSVRPQPTVTAGKPPYLETDI